MTTWMKWMLLSAAALAAAASPAHAQQADARWSPWIGCWQAVASAEEEPQSEDLLCVRPESGGVEVIEVVQSRPRASQLLVADGQPHDVTAEGCSGWRSVEFSLDGQRLFTRAEQACADDPVRPSTGVIAMVSPREWIDVQATDVDGHALSWVRRYRPAPAAVVEAAGFAELAARGAPGIGARAAAVTPDVDDVIEASGTIDTEAVRAWIAELNDPFDLDSRRLIRLADAGVPENVIDVMIAVSYPDRFALQHSGDIDEMDGRDYGRNVYMGSSIWNRGFYWSPFGYGYGYGGGYYGYPYYYDPGVVIVVPNEDVEPDARVVKGRGYTRGRPSSGSSPQADPPARRSEQPNGGGSSGSSGGSSQPSSGGSSGGGSEGRTAKPRGN